MTKIEATAEVFYTAFKALPKRERDAFVTRLAQDEGLRKDFMDIAVALERQGEPSRPLDDVLGEIEGRKRAR